MDIGAEINEVLRRIEECEKTMKRMEFKHRGLVIQRDRFYKDLHNLKAIRSHREQRAKHESGDLK